MDGQSLLPPNRNAQCVDAISLSTLGTETQSKEPLLHEALPTSGRSNLQDEARLPRLKLQSWRFVIASAATAAGSVLLVNAVFVIAASARSPISSGIGILYQGSCSAVNLWSVVLHLVINILSSIPLCGSNYTMQCLSAPTRGELDKAHVKGDWLDIGTPSVLLAGEKFLDMSSFHDEFDAWRKRSSSNVSYEYLQAFQSYSNMSTHYVAVENMTGEDYIASHATQFIQDRGPVIAIAANFSDGVNRSFVDFEAIGGYGGLGLPGGNDATWTSSWQCGQNAANPSTPFCNPPSCQAEERQCDMRSNQEREAALLWNPGSGWNNTAYDFRYCLSAKVSGQCRLHFSLHILIVVIVCNIFKCGVMLWTLRLREATIVTLGDAITSFLDRPDAQSRQVTLISRLDMSKSDESLTTTWFGHLIHMKSMLSWNRRAVAATGRRRWSVTFLLCTTGLSVTLWLLVYGASKLGGSGTKGFGTLDPNAIVTFGKAKIRQNGAIGLIYMVLLVNLPQLICTFLYFLYNSLVTSALLAVEWNSYYLRTKKAYAHPIPMVSTRRILIPEGRQYRGHCCFTSQQVHEPIWELRDLRYTASRRQGTRLVKRKHAQVEVRQGIAKVRP